MPRITSRQVWTLTESGQEPQPLLTMSQFQAGLRKWEAEPERYTMDQRDYVELEMPH